MNKKHVSILTCITLLIGCNKNTTTITLEATPYHDKVFRSIDQSFVVTMVSSKELEISRGGVNYLCKYSEEGGKIRVIFTELGTSQVLYFRNTPDGIQTNDGNTLFSPSIFKIRCEELELAAARGLSFACMEYTTNHNEYFPKRLEDLVPKYTTQQQLRSPLSTDPIGFEIVAEKFDFNTPPMSVMLRGKNKTIDGKRVIVSCSMQASFVQE